VNNAGISVSGPLEFVPLEDLRRQFEVNVFGQVAVTQRFLPLLRAGRGRIVNMSSIAGRSTAPLLGPYSASKFALEACNDALRRELHPWGIHVSCVEPGAIATPIWKKALDAADGPAAATLLRAGELYAKPMKALRRFGEHADRTAVPAELVARVVHHALTARKPKTRYLVGKDAKIQAMLTRLLPDRMLDAVFRKLLRID
jgi:NAD(P)-dependent dehydrogenase (short-subunit alcohol dehydrogenase family)